MSLSDYAQLAAMLYGIHKANQPPKFYTAPNTPQEQWKTDALKNLFDYSSGWTNQYLGGISNLNPDFRLNTDLAGNPAFMGGLKLPNIDMSKLQAPSVGGASTATVAPKATANGTAASGPTGIPGDAFGHVTSPAGSQYDPFSGMYGVPNGNAVQINSWDDIKKLGAQAFNFAMSLNSAGVPFAAIAAKVSQMFTTKPEGIPTLPLVHNDVSAANLKPSGVIRDAVPGQTQQQQSGANFIGGQEYNLASAHNQLAPDAMGGNRDIFGGGGYSGWYTETPWGKRVPMPGKRV